MPESTTVTPYAGMLPDEDDLEPLDHEAAPGGEEEIKPCMRCMAPNDVQAVRCSECGAFFAEPSMFPGVLGRRSLFQPGVVSRAGSSRPTKIQLSVTISFNLLIIAINVLGMVSSWRYGLVGIRWLLVALNGAFAALCLWNISVVVRSYWRLPDYWQDRD